MRPWENHHGKHDPAGEDARTGTRRLAKDGAHGGVHHREADEAVDDGRNAHEELDQGLKDAATEARLDLHHEDGAAERDGKREERRQEHDAEGGYDQRERAVDAIGGNPAGARDERQEADAVDEER